MNKLFWILLITGLFLFIFAESNYLNNKNLFFENSPLWGLVWGSMGVTLLLCFFPTITSNKASTIFTHVLKVGLLTSTVFVIFVEASIVDFAGMKLGPEVVFHFSWDAFVLGVKEYAMPLTVLALFMVLLNLAVWSVCRGLQLKHYIGGTLAGLLLLMLGFNETIYGRLFAGYQEYQSLMSVRKVYEEDMLNLAPLGINPILTNKAEIEASQQTHKNLVVIYLESFNAAFVNHPRYPGLTNRLDELMKSHQVIKPYISTGHFTMDGLISSHCGFIPNMLIGNNTLATGEKFFYEIPCFTDVLSAAGFHQEFFGGAKKSFAGKQDFLLDHGYNQVWGREDFEDEHAQSMSWWGLYDDHLFDLALLRIKELTSTERPFHISILTLDTHLKGFPSPSCPEYTGSEDPFINAIHCTDFLVGQFIDQLKAHGLLNNMTLIITGDHPVFNTSLTRGLLGENALKTELLGIIVDPDQAPTIHAMGLYDLGPTVLELLNISHNVSFILGDPFGGPANRPLFTRNELYELGEAKYLSRDCTIDSNRPVTTTENMSYCDHQSIIRKVYGYTEKFNKSTDLVFRSESKIELLFSEDRQSLQDVTLDGQSIIQKFRFNGFLMQNKMFADDGLFVIDINHVKKRVDALLFFKQSNNLARFIKDTNKTDSSLILFSNQTINSQTLLQQMNNHAPNLLCSVDHTCVVQNLDHDPIIINASSATTAIML